MFTIHKIMPIAADNRGHNGDSVSISRVNKFIEGIQRALDESDLAMEQKEKLVREIDAQRVLCIG